MSLLESIIARARATPKRIVLCEAEDPRVLHAARRATDDGIAHIILVGELSKITAAGQMHDISLNGMEIVDPTQSVLSEQLQQALLELRRKRGMTPEQAEVAVRQPLVFATLMLRQGLADGSVAGAVHTTADVVRNAIQIVGTRPETRLVSSFFLMLRERPFHTTTQAMIFSDCGLVIDPTEEELSDIALAATDSAHALLNDEPKVAMLSFSTRGSAKHQNVEKVRRATERVKSQRPQLAIEGDVQLDAAIVPQVALSKTPGSAVAGQANVLIFPNLDAANIAYKLTERLGEATAIGPLLQGLNKPANDLSRGCSANDVYNVIAVTGVQAQALSATA
ncbi:phosphate acetyltransferase [Pusillimonas sp. MFBS29]|uniref:phosphate acetyltransferase n=1 Tax=Pusillimonas sp. MFBS29 TaxID=2886690 RepID=UPI001D115788|nr:phosphate acetyltransferase [Pusillimonas sp. MFBS29]MCC2596443.1 phosphate acetyltransferase [Pusillimonas sp. MFBS29]